jgi:hypothetical protein
MADLNDVTKRLVDNNNQNMVGHKYTAEAITQLNNRFDAFFRYLKEQAPDKLEDKREAKTERKTQRATSSSKGGGSGGFGALAGLGSLAGITTGLAALGASFVGLDDALKALRVGQIATSIGKGITRFGKGVISVIDEIIKTTALLGGFVKDLSKSIIIPEETKNLLKSLPEKLKTGILNIFQESELLKPFRTALYNFQNGFNRVGTKATGIVDNILKVEDFGTISGKLGAMIGSVKNVFVGADGAGGINGFFTKISDGFSEVIKFFPRIDFSKLLSAFGSFENGTGLLGFFGKIVGFLDPLLAPIKKIIGLALRPMFQLFLSLIDFVVGFYQGFTSEDGNLVEKLGAGLEGGIKGVIKGFTQAIDLILIEFPAWILKKLGFSGVAEGLKKFKLTDLVDPVWETIKNYFKKLFNDPAGTLGGNLMSAANVVNDFIKSVLRSILPTANSNKNWYDPVNLASKAIPKFVYDYAGIDKKTGAIIAPEAGQMINGMGQGGVSANQISAMQEAAQSGYRPSAGSAAVGQVGNNVTNIDQGATFMGGMGSTTDTFQHAAD